VYPHILLVHLYIMYLGLYSQGTM